MVILLPGMYTVDRRARASWSSGEPRVIPSAGAAMWMPTRQPPSCEVTEKASSISVVVASSIENARTGASGRSSGWAGNAMTFKADGVEFVGVDGVAGDWAGLNWSSAVSASSYLRNSTISDAADFALSIDSTTGIDFTGNTIENTTGYCIRKLAEDTTDYAASNTLNCTAGDIQP